MHNAPVKPITALRHSGLQVKFPLELKRQYLMQLMATTQFLWTKAPNLSQLSLQNGGDTNIAECPKDTLLLGKFWDAYTRRFDEILSNLPRKVKVVDDCLLYDDDIESSFYHAFDFLLLCAKNGVTINVEKFQFCQDTVEFAGLIINSTGIAPSEKLLSAIKDFPTPVNITDARSWFGLVNQAAWAYSLGPIMEPFRNLVKHNSTFHWDANLDQIFAESKEIILEKISEGLRTFDTSHITCLQPDWSKTGLGYLLLHKYCDCSIDNAPICCPDGWRLVFAGSRFTQNGEPDFAPTEGEALSLSWSLNHAKNFVLGCRDLIVVTDHKPLLGIFNDRD